MLQLDSFSGKMSAKMRSLAKLDSASAALRAAPARMSIMVSPEEVRLSQLIYTYDNPVSRKHLEQAREVLIQGGLVAYPTDVNWACGCLCDHKGAARRLQQLKATQGLAPKPIAFMFASLAQLSAYAELNTQAFRILKKILPGPYTVILSSHKRLPKIIADKRKEIGIRIPDSELLLRLSERLPVPLATVSLTLPGQVRGDEPPARPRFGHEIAAAYEHDIDLILDLSTELSYRETTVIRLVADQVGLVRRGDEPMEPWLAAMLSQEA